MEDDLWCSQTQQLQQQSKAGVHLFYHFSFFTLRSCRWLCAPKEYVNYLVDYRCKCLLNCWLLLLYLRCQTLLLKFICSDTYIVWMYVGAYIISIYIYIYYIDIIYTNIYIYIYIYIY